MMILTSKKISNFFTLLLLLSLFNACTPSQEKTGNRRTFSASQALQSSGTPQEKSFAFSQSAEWVLKTHNIAEADRMADQALALDPENAKAQFIKIIDTLLLKLKGSDLRIAEFLRDKPHLLKGFQIRFLEPDKNSTDPIRQLRTAPSEYAPFQSERDIQSYIDDLLTTLLDLHQFSVEHSDLELSLESNNLYISLFNLNPHHDFAQSCELRPGKNDEFEIVCPDNSLQNAIHFDIADWMQLRLFAAYHFAMLSSYNSFDLIGYFNELESIRSEEVSEMPPSAARTSIEQQLYERLYKSLIQNPQFGGRRSPELTRKIKAMGQDLVLALRWANQNQNKSCPKGFQSSVGLDLQVQRLGQAFPYGFCMGPGLGTYFDSISDIFSGKPTLRTAAQDGGYHTTQIQWMALFDNPEMSLRDIGPLEFDACGNVMKVGDPTLGGTFPLADANEHIPKESSLCRQ